MEPLKTPAPQETKLHFLDYWRIIRIRKTVILAVFLLVVITATLVTFILPEYYASTARIKVERDQSDISFQTQQMPAGLYDPYFIQTEFEVIQSELVLGKVVDTLKLRDDHGKEVPFTELYSQRYNNGTPLTRNEAIAIIKGHMDLRPVRNTSLIEIKVISEKPEEAKRIANAVAETYQKHRTEERRSLSMGGIASLEERVKDQEEKVRKAQDKVNALREELKIPDAFASGDTPTMLLTAESLRKIENTRIESQTEYVRQKTLLDHLKSLNPSDLAQVIPTAAQDTLLGSLLEQLTIAEQKLIALTKDFGDKNPEVEKASSQVNDLQQKIDKRVKGILDGLEARVVALREGVITLSNEVARATEQDIDSARRSRPYFAAKRDLEELQKFQQLLYVKIASERVETDLPKKGVVQIIDPAIEGARPVRPNKPLNIALGIIIGLVVGVGLAFFIEYLDTSVKTIDDVERSLGSPVLGVIPQNVGILLDEGAESPHAEAYRVLRTNLLFSRKDDKLNTVAVVSAGAGEGKSTTVFNLAAVFAQSGQRVLIVDSDLRRPTLHKMMHVGNNIGLTNYLLKQNKLEEVIQTTSLPTLDFLASGKLPSSSLGILSSAQMKDLINELKQRYDFVFFDSPPVMGVSDASILASEVDMTLQVIQYRRYPQPMNIRAKQLIEKVGGNLVGIVLNNINMSQDESYYYYSGYYHEYYSRNEDQEPAENAQGSGDKDKLDIS
jgi:polysaccharide biosynthesis transport protein